MPRSVSIKAGSYNVELPNGQVYQATNASGAAGPTVVLTDEEAARLNPASFGTTLVDNGAYGTVVPGSDITQAPYVAAEGALTAVAVSANSAQNVTTPPTATSVTASYNTLQTQVASIKTQFNALLTDVTNLRSKLNAELAALQTATGPQAAS